MEKHRPDVDGLRAIAILAVLGFHAFPTAVPGGFVGVDVFFVISGFLISGIILRGLRDGSFSFTDFYLRRARRIFPALITVLVTTYVVGWFVLFANEFEQLGKHIAGGVGFVSNLILWSESGYFENAADAKPLLHLWSLGIEEQFYIVWPLLLWAAWKRQWNLLVIMLAIAIVSFGVNMAVTKKDIVAAFYSPATRFWELMIGGILAYVSLNRATVQWSNAKSTVGIALIAAAIVLLDRDQKFPGWRALLPSVGACLLISAGPQGWFNRVLAHRYLVWIGLISYPLYLWHWPIISFTHIVTEQELTVGLGVAAIAASFLLAWLTYRFIEQPIRFGGFKPAKVAALCATMAVLAGVGTVTYAQDGLRFRPVHDSLAHVLDRATLSHRMTECFDIDNAHKADRWYCRLNKGRQPKAFVFGDSHALALMPAFERVAQEKQIDILFAGFSGCAPILGIRMLRQDQNVRDCQALNERVFEFVTRDHISDVFLVARWTFYTDGDYNGKGVNFLTDGERHNSKDLSRAAFRRGLAETVSRYRAAGVKVHIVEQVPMQRSAAKRLYRTVFWSANRDEVIDDLSVPLAQHRSFQSFVSSAIAAQRGVDVINLDSVYCRQDVCPLSRPDRSIYVDADHLSESGAYEAVNVLSARF